MKPHKDNFCGGNFQDWLEVNLTNKCNAKCKWCVEKKGWHPKKHAPWKTICKAAISSGKTNIILLGGEPTLHKDLKKIIKNLHDAGKRVWVTTNGSKLTKNWVSKNMIGIYGVNISIHHYNLLKNEIITSVQLDEKKLVMAISELHSMGATVRLNCNCIKGYIDSRSEINQYIEWGKLMGANKIRFAELKHDDNKFVDLAAILDHQYGLNDDPYIHGCNQDTVINGMPVNFRQMCGMQTKMRKLPDNPEIIDKNVLYYDGNMYDGWQTRGGLIGSLNDILYNVKDGKISVEDALKKIKEL